jgi:HK97 gp10 family phage protein
MSAVSFSLKNSPEFMKWLGQLKDSVRGEAMTNALTAGGFVIEAQAKINVEHQGLVKTGNLMNSIQKQDLTITKNGGEITVGTGVIYAAIHEFGGIIKAVRAKMLSFVTEDGVFHRVKAVHMPARPYLRPAVDNHHEEIIDAACFQLQKAIQKNV